MYSIKHCNVEKKFGFDFSEGRQVTGNDPNSLSSEPAEIEGLLDDERVKDADFEPTNLQFKI